MFKRFTSPPWQSPDAEQRRQAVETLGWDTDAEALAQVARDDALPAIRRLALRQIVDLDLLAERSGQDPDASVRERAASRYREVLAGLAEGAPPLEERLARLTGSADAALLEHLAREGREDALREHAIARVEREAVLRDVALKDPVLALRLAALARIQDESVLARVHDQSRKTDKRVNRAARERLEAIRAPRERPGQVAAQCEQICNALERLGADGHWERDAALQAQLEQRWNGLEAEYRQAFEQRFTDARARFALALESHRAAAGPILTAKETVIRNLIALAEPPADGERGDGSAWLAQRESGLREARAAWRQIEALPEAEEVEIAARFHDAEQGLRAAITGEQRRNALSRLLREHDRLLASRGPIPEAEVKALERAMDGLPGKGPGDDGPGRKLARAHDKLRDRLRKQAEWKEETLAALPARFDTLEAAVAEGRAPEAVAQHDAIAADLDALLGTGTSADRLSPLRARLKPLTREAKLMRAWGRFGAQQACERLCEEMEALKGSGDDPRDIAQRVRAARDAWKELSRGGAGVDQALWRRFDGAATEAYLPCKAFFAERSAARKENLARRRDLAEELDRFLDGAAGGPDMDWKAAVRFRRQLLKDWQEAHPVERKAGKALADRFDARLADLDGLLGRERERCARHREQLIDEAAALAGNPDKRAAAEACKQLQRQWVVTVPGPRGQEQALWERFRSACDDVFAGRQQVFEEQRAGWKAGLEERETLCRRVEELLECDVETVAEAERALHRAQGEWSRSPPLPKREGERLEKRFKDAVRRFARHKRDLEAQARQSGLALLGARAALCHEAEGLAAPGSAAAAGPALVDALTARWQSLPALPDRQAHERLSERFQQALDALGDGVAPDEATLAANLAERARLCLRMEILAGVDSPPEHAKARMALQVERLASALGERSSDGADTPDALFRAWCLGGPAPAAEAAALEARFQRAWAARPGNAANAR